MQARPEDLPCRFLMALCRPGFEAECGQELERTLQRHGLTGRAEICAGAGQVRVGLEKIHCFGALDRAIRLATLTFARQLAFGFEIVGDLPDKDRVSPLLAAAERAATPFSALLPEAGDGDRSRPLAGLCRRLQAPLERQFEKRHLLRPKRTHLPRLHVLLAERGEAWLGVSRADNASPWPMGIPRLRMSAEAPSRSALKLAEALLVLLTPDELAHAMRPGQRAVDLGAAPGGWSWQLAGRGLHVTAIDNGPLAASALATGMIEHVRADGFTWRPRSSVDWLVCDMVEQPARIAALVTEWVATGRARRAIFNLKLPMKKRLAELERCRQAIHARLDRDTLPHVLRVRQLYHDREEVTAYLALSSD